MKKLKRRKKSKKKVKRPFSKKEKTYFGLYFKKSQKKLRKSGRLIYRFWRRRTRRYRKNLFYGVTLVVAFMLIWRGFWYLADETPALENPIISIAIGVALILFLGARTKLVEF
ncbi:hypothetical protein HYU92_04825 [Candidatus Curtissbacteria bacterium]|nr:hypothetical protein [Candidatus Curtissbacteria bacterium]